jgi:hypothetical protein
MKTWPIIFFLGIITLTGCTQPVATTQSPSYTQATSAKTTLPVLSKSGNGITQQFNLQSENPSTQLETQETQKTPIEHPSYTGKISYFKDDVFIQTGNKKYLINLQDTTTFENLESRYTTKDKQLIAEAKTNAIWYGLISDLSKYIHEGESVKIDGTLNPVSASITAEKITLLSPS